MAISRLLINKRKVIAMQKKKVNYIRPWLYVYSCAIKINRTHYFLKTSIMIQKIII